MNPNDIYQAYFNAGQQYAAIVQPYALHLVGLLILVEIGTISITYMFGDSDNPPAAGWSIVRLLFTGGFAFWWAENAWPLAVTVVGSFDQIGQKLSGLPSLDPMQFLKTGMSLINVIWSAPATGRMVPDIGAALEQVVLCFAILIIFLIVAALVILTLTAFFLIVGPGSILVAFMPCRFTTSLSENYFTWVVRIGVIVMLFYVVLGTAQEFALQYTTTLNAVCKPVLAVDPLAALGAIPLSVTTTVCSNPIPTDEMIQILADMIILAFICAGVPFIGGALVNHGINMTLEHLASAKYLASGIGRAVAGTLSTVSHQISQAVNNHQQQTTLNQRMAAGAAAAQQVSSSQPQTPPAPNVYGVQSTQALPVGARQTTQI
jgi:hypothetical protein